jgi:hypothetical protein
MTPDEMKYILGRKVKERLSANDPITQETIL